MRVSLIEYVCLKAVFHLMHELVIKCKEFLYYINMYLQGSLSRMFSTCILDTSAVIILLCERERKRFSLFTKTKVTCDRRASDFSEIIN